MRVDEIKAIKIKLASPEDILSWSHGEVTKPETINYRTQRAEKDGLFCERIFGPEKDFECYCGKYKRVRYKGITCDRCGVEVTRASVRRERLGHIKLATPVSHIWFLRGVPSRMGLFLDKPMQALEKVIYFAAYIITKVDKEAKENLKDEIEKEFKSKAKTLKTKKERDLLKEAKARSFEEINKIQKHKILSEAEHRNLSLKYGEIFESGTGAETLRNIFSQIDLKELAKELEGQVKNSPPVLKRKILKRLRLVKQLIENNLRPEWMFLTVLPVIPPDLRPMVQLDGGRYASSDLNDLYRRVINRNNRLKYLFELRAPEVIIRNEKRMLQEAVDAMIDNSARKSQTTTASTGGRRLLKSLADMLKGKQGRFRQNLLGKRVDYSGRSVIIIGPELKLHQCGIPKKMALELFKPFVINKLIGKGLAYNIRGAGKLIEQAPDEVWAALEEVIKDKYVLLNRAPTLHRLGIQAFQPILIEGESIQIHPLVCTAFNADFDGDQMAVHIPLSEEAQAEAREIMLSSLNLLKPATGIPVVSPTNDIILGCYWLTKIIEGAFGEGKVFANPREAILAYEYKNVDLKAMVKVRMPLAKIGKGEGKEKKEGFLETSVGRLIFNEVLPEDFPFWNDTINKKKMAGLIADIIEKYGFKGTQPILDRIKDLGFEFSTLSGISWGMDDIKVPEEKKELIAQAQKETEQVKEHYLKGFLSPQERRAKNIEIWYKVMEKIEKLVPQTLAKLGSPVYSIIDAGARGTWSQPTQMAGMKGLVNNPAGQIIELPVISSFKEGFNVLEYFISTHGARKGASDTALRTATAGYLTRRLVDVVHDIIIREEDCKDDKGITIYRVDAQDVGQNFAEKIIGRIILEDLRIPIQDTSGQRRFKTIKKGEIINKTLAKLIDKSEIDKVQVRSPLSCKTIFGVCQKCYGWDFGNNQLIKLGEAAGVVAAQAIGEPGTQLTMRTFHTGGVVSGGDITQGLPRVEEIFEARPPQGKATISDVCGIIKEIKEKDKQKIIKIKVIPDEVKPNKKSKKEEIKEIIIPFGVEICIEKGDKIEKGDSITKGSIDLKELYRFSGLENTQRYIEKEVQRIYVSHGAQIHSKHLEVIIRKMFSRVRVKEPGSSKFLVDEVVERDIFLDENRKLKKEGKTLAKGQRLLLGISKVALTCDSFLSAASFQETSRILINSALAAKEDGLHGLKENVIIGKLIPVGTGFRKDLKSRFGSEETLMGEVVEEMGGSKE